MSNKSEAYTEDLADFGARERKLAGELLAAGLPEGFDDGVKLAMNRNSGYVFLVNSDYQCAMMNGDKVQIFHTTPYNGHEGFITDLLANHKPNDLNEEDVRYIVEAAKAERAELSGDWAAFDAGE